MPTKVAHDGVHRLVEHDGQLVEVLAKEYEQEHLPDAINLPLEMLNANVLPQDTQVFMHKHQLDSVLVTSPDGQLIGLLKQSDADQILPVTSQNSMHQLNHEHYTFYNTSIASI